MLEAALKEPTPPKEPHAKGKPAPMPPNTHTLTDLLITLSPHLPQECYSTLFTLSSSILPLSSDPQLQKKAYKLLPRLATSTSGALALRAHNSQLQTLLLSTASTATAPTRRDRLSAIAVVVEHLPPTDLHFLPAILSEVVLAAKEVNEKARTQAFDLLILMARKMREGGVVIQAKIPNMSADAPEVQASLEEFFTMVSAGLVGGSPHVVSASITALTRILYDFASELDRPVIEDLVQTMEMFLTSANREIVRSVLGFVKVAIISLPEEVVKPRLEALVPGLMAWSIGAEVVERCCPEDDKKFIHNIRKTKERSKRQKAAAKEAGEDGDDAPENAKQRKKREFDSAYDDALASDSDDSADSNAASDEDNGEGRGGKRGGKNRKGDEGGTYITENADEPLDLLSRSSLAHISSRKPAKSALPGSAKKERRHKMDLDGKLVFTGRDDDDDEGDAMVIDGDGGADGGLSLEEGVNAYVDAIKGRDAVQRGRGGRLKYSTKREKRGGGMDVDGDGDGDDAGGNKRVRFAGASEGGSGRGRGGRGDRGGGGGFRGRGGGGIGKRVERRGLGGGRVRGGRVGKVSGGGRGGRR